MVKHAVCVLAFGSLVATASAEPNVSGYFAPGGIGVPANESASQEDSVIVGDGSEFRKVGEGSLSIPLSKVDRPDDVNMSVMGGTLTLTAGEGVAIDTSVPPAAMRKAAFWVNADSAIASESDGASYVSKWVDVRDIDHPDAPSYPYATPGWTTTSVKQGVNPELVESQGVKAVKFGDYDGRYMNFSKTFTNVRHLFLVHGTERVFGAVVGYMNPRRGGMVIGLGSSVTDISRVSSYFTSRADMTPDYASAEFHRDGVRFDPFMTAPITNHFELLEVRFTHLDSRADNFFHCGCETYYNYGASADNGTQGGGSLAEALVFTVPLTDEECLQIQRYLMAKYSLPRALPRAANAGMSFAEKTVRFATAAGTSVSVRADEDETTAPVSFSGNGSVTKTGAGRMLVGTSGERDFGGTFVLEEGDVLARCGRLPATVANPGDSFATEFFTPTGDRAASSAVDAASGIRLTRSEVDGSPDAVKTGKGRLSVNAVAEGVRRLVVNGGTLALEGRRLTSDCVAGGAITGAIFNADFEMPFVADVSNGRGTFGGNPKNGWKKTSVSDAQYICYTNSTGAANPYYPNVGILPENGSQVLLLNQSGSAQADVVIPKAGYYEVSLMALARYRGEKNIDFVEVKFGESAESAQLVGTCRPNARAWTKFRFRLPYVNAGTAVLQVFGKYVSSDNAAFVDNFKVVYLGDREPTVALRVPNGDFETVPYSTGSAGAGSVIGRYIISNVATGWSLSATGGNTDPATYPYTSYIGLVAPCMNMQDPYGMSPGAWNYADRPYGSTSLCFLRSAGKAESSSFDVPAGKFRLQASVAWFGTDFHPYQANLSTAASEENATYYPTFKATLTVGGTAYDLGSVEAVSHIARVQTWPNEVEISEATTATLTIVQTESTGGGTIDDLAFVSDDDVADRGENLLRNGNFDDLSNGTIPPWTCKSDNSYYLYASSGAFGMFGRPSVYGYVSASGEYSALLKNTAAITQSVRFPKKGLYRLSFLTRTRCDNVGYGGNRLRLWTVAEGSAVTNVIESAEPQTYSRNYTEHNYYFTVPEAGIYTFGMEGMGAPGASASSELTTFVDDVSIRYVRDEIAPPIISEPLKISVAEGSRLILDYTGTVTVATLRLGGVPVHGTVCASDYPDFLAGAGEIEVKPKGSVIILR